MIHFYRSTVESAVALAKRADVSAVVMFVGLDTHSVEREGHDRTDLSLPHQQQELIELVADAAGGKPLVLCLLNGGPVALDWAKSSDSVSGILEAFYPSRLGAQVRSVASSRVLA